MAYSCRVLYFDMIINKKSASSADVSVPPPTGGVARFDEQPGNPLHNEDALSHMSDEGCPNEDTPSVPDATGYS
jgi:hypothetical protein